MGQYTKKGLLNGYKKNNTERAAYDYYATPAVEVENILNTLYEYFGVNVILPSPTPTPTPTPPSGNSGKMFKYSFGLLGLLFLLI